MGNRYGPRADEFAWTLGARRRLLRYMDAELSYAECALLLGTSRGSVAAMVNRLKHPLLNPAEQLERRQRRAYEAAQHGRRSREQDAHRLIEPWKVYTARKQKERAEARAAALQVPLVGQDSD